MLTPQEVKEKTFSKATIGGYAMAAVDEFLDSLTEDYGSLYKENAALKAKVKGLMEKIDEYRQVEDAMRSTLLAAKKTAAEIVSEAESKRDAISAEAEQRKSALVADAEAIAKRRVTELQEQIAGEERRLEETRLQVAAAMATEEKKLEAAKVAVSRFLQATRTNCEEQMKVLARLEELKPEPVQFPAAPARPAPAAQPVPQPAPAEVKAQPAAEQTPKKPPVKETPAEEPEHLPEEHELVVDEDFFTSPLPTLDQMKKAKEAENAAPELPAEVGASSNEEPADQESIWDDLPEEATRVIKLDELQFGRNYTKED